MFHYCSNKTIDLKLVEYLIRNKAIVNYQSDIQASRTPLHYFCEHKLSNNEVLKYLINSKANVNAKDEEVYQLGKIKLKVLHTPGHTLESVCILLMDENNGTSVK